MFKQYSVLSLLVLLLGLGSLACSDDPQGFGGSFSSSGFSNFVLVDANGQPIPGATIFVPGGGGLALTATSSGSNFLGLVDDDGQICDDPVQDFSFAECAGGDGSITIFCVAGETTTALVQVNGEIVGEIEYDCDGLVDGDEEMVDDFFQNPLGFISLFGELVTFDTGTNQQTDILTNDQLFPPPGDGDGDGDGDPAIFDIATAPNGTVVATAFNDFLDLAGMGGDAEILVINPENNQITRIPVSDEFPLIPLNIAVSPDGLKAYFTALTLPVFLGGIGIDFPGFVGVVSLVTNEFVGSIVVPPLFFGPGDQIVFTDGVEFNPAGGQAVVTAVEVANVVCCGGGDGDGDATGFAVVIDSEFNTYGFEDIVPFDLGGDGDGDGDEFFGGPVAIAGNKAFVVSNTLSFFAFAVGGGVGAGCAPSTAVIDLADDNDLSFIDYTGGDGDGDGDGDFPTDQCPASIAAAADESEVYIGSAPFLVGAPDAFISTVSASSETITQVLDLAGNAFPYGMASSPGGNVYVSAVEGDGDGDGDGDFDLAIFDPVTNTLLEDTVTISPTEFFPIPFPPFNLTVQGGE